MWPKQKPKNRRLEREHVLDVKFRAQDTQSTRLRLASMALAIILGTTAAFFLLWRGSVWAADELVYHNPAFGIKELEIQTDGVIPIEQLRLWAGVKEGDNLFALDLSRIERDLELQPLIQRAVVERVLPQTLKLRIIEREPIAQISGFQPRSAGGEIKSTLFYIDEAGHIMVPLESPRSAPPAPDSLPVLTGVMGAELSPGKRVSSPQMHAALKLITEFDHSPMAGLVDLKSLDVSSTQVVQVSTRQGNEIIFALDSLDRQLRRWRIVHDYAAQEGKSIALLDLSVTNNVPARWHEAGAVPPVHPSPVKPSPYKKNKHV
jgi:cell division protein FtsQ